MNYYLEAKKSLGQNFLKNKTIVQRIAESGDIAENETIIEIGPGTGELTEGLLHQAKKFTHTKVVVIEKDNRAIPLLQERFAEEIKNHKLEIIEGDFLEMDISGFTNYKIIANIPYYITGSIIRKSLELINSPLRLVFLVQKEVAERVIARDGKESILSQSVKVYGTPHILMTVSRGNFVPVPKVDSAVLIIDNISHNKLSRAHIDEKRFFDVVHAGFAHKRKKLISNLRESKTLDLHASTSELEKIFTDLKLDIQIRAEDLNTEQWLSLASQIK